MNHSHRPDLSNFLQKFDWEVHLQLFFVNLAQNFFSALGVHVHVRLRILTACWSSSTSFGAAGGGRWAADDAVVGIQQTRDDGGPVSAERRRPQTFLGTLHGVVVPLQPDPREWKQPIARALSTRHV